MKLYLDDDTAARYLIALGRKTKREIISPEDVGMTGQHDALHLLHAIQNQCVMVTRNFSDYEPLHKLVVGCGGKHPGILLIRSDNDRTRDMKPQEIVTAVNHLEKSGIQLENQLVVLNQWR